MAETDFGALTGAQKKIWAAETWQAGRDESFMFSSGFVGANEKDMNKPVYRVTKLTPTERGTICVMQLIQDLQNDGTVGDNKLEDNEEALVNDLVEIRIDQLRHGVKSKGEMAEQATVIRFRSTARSKLSFWLGDKIDELGFLTLAGRSYTLKTNGATRAASQLPQLSFAADVVAASSGRIMYAGAASDEATLTAADKMSWNLLVALRTMAERKKIKPIRDRGKPYYIVVMSPEQARDLRMDNTYQSIVKDGRERGSNNPLFTGALAVVDGLVLHSHNKVFNTLGLASSNKWGNGGTVDGAQAQLMGAQAMGLATIGDSFMRESDNTDYGNKPGLAFGRKIGMLKPQFKSIEDGETKQDFGTIALKTAAAA